LAKGDSASLRSALKSDFRLIGDGAVHQSQRPTPHRKQVAAGDRLPRLARRRSRRRGEHAANENLRLANLWAGIDIHTALIGELDW
jgi:hypothetical protein